MAGWSHLASRKGLVSGIVLGGYGFGGSLYGLYYHNKIAMPHEEPVYDSRDGNLYFPKEVGARYPEIHKQVCVAMLVVSAFAISLVSNFRTAVDPKMKLRRSKSSLTMMTPAKRERLTVLSKNYMTKNVHERIGGDQ